MKELMNEKYLINKIEKNLDSTDGNVYTGYRKNKKYIIKVYDELSHTNSMVLLHNYLLINGFYVPSIVKNKDNEYYTKYGDRYIVVYTFLEGIQIAYLDYNKKLIKEIAQNLYKLHEKTSGKNMFNLDKIPFKLNIDRKSVVHFDLTKHNVFYNAKIGFIDFDDAKYGPSICDVAIILSLLFLTKSRGADIDSIRLFIESYYKNNTSLKEEEVPYIKEVAIKWINYILNNNQFDSSLKESFETKKKLIDQYL